jgi:exonuclease 3'-5' domain-containing protein 1
MSPPKDFRVEVTDTQLSLRSVLDCVPTLPTDPPSLFCNLEGTNLGRNGSIVTLSICAVPTNTAYLVDVQLLGSDAFASTTKRQVSLKSTLESSTIPKVFFDVRNGSDALLELYRVALSDVKDVQPMELGCRPAPDSAKRYLATLVDCVANCSASSDVRKERQRAEHNVALSFDTQKREAANVPNKRPFGMEIEQRRMRNLHHPAWVA